MLLLLVARALLIGTTIPQCSTMSSAIIIAWLLGHCVFQQQAGKQHERAYMEGCYGTDLGEAGVLTFADQWRALYQEQDREIGVFRHMAPTRGYVSNFFVRLASS